MIIVFPFRLYNREKAVASSGKRKATGRQLAMGKKWLRVLVAGVVPGYKLQPACRAFRDTNM
jgi:hypothetical protein